MHLRHSRCTCTTASRGFGPRTTPTWSKACARRDGRADASGHGSWCWLDPVQTTSMSIRSELAEVIRPFTTGSDYVNQIGLETDEGFERIKAVYRLNYEACGCEEQVRSAESRTSDRRCRENPLGRVTPECAGLRFAGGAQPQPPRVGAIQIDSSPRPRIPSARPRPGTAADQTRLLTPVAREPRRWKSSRRSTLSLRSLAS
jgi:hypothetical protein